MRAVSLENPKREQNRTLEIRTETAIIVLCAMATASVGYGARFNQLD